MREHVLKEDFSYNDFDHGRTSLSRGCVLSETMSNGLTCLTGRHIPLEDISKGDETCFSLRYIFCKITLLKYISYWRICHNGGMLCRRTCVMERNREWRIYCKDGGHLSWVDMYFGSYYYKGCTGIFCVYVKVWCVCMPRVG